MLNKFLYLLEEINYKFNEKLFEELKSCFENELDFDELYKQEKRVSKALNSAPIEFYEYLASNFVFDLNEAPEIFLEYEVLLSYLSSTNLNDFYNIALTLTNSDEDAYYYITGLKYLQNNSVEMALLNFNEIEHYFVDYFIYLCYLNLENYENAIISLNRLNINLEYYNDDIFIELENGDKEKLLNTPGMIILKWNIFNDLGYAYNQIKNYKKALNAYEESLKIFNLEQNYKIRHKLDENERFDDFLIFCNNYLFAIEKNGKYKKAIEVMNFIIEKYPNKKIYLKQKELYIKKANEEELTDNIIKNLLNPKKRIDEKNFQKTKLLSKEKNLEDMIVEQIKNGFQVFDRNFEIYQNENIYGRQYYIQKANGFLDLLLIDKDTNIVYVVELKRKEAGTEVIEQIQRYITGLKPEIENEIRGIICLHKPTKQLTELISKHNNLELYAYSFEFKKIK